jgi:NAD(P)-dependent dehydrogenase (short-subunit alcohol dehydrogenase family)
MFSELSGKTALVTGSTSGIGRATAYALAVRGAHVIISGRDVNRGVQSVEEIQLQGGTATFVPADLSTPEGPAALAEQAIEAGGGDVDILVNNAGIYPFGPSSAFTATDIDRVYNANVRAPFLLTGILAPLMGARGYGSVVNLGSIVATNGIPGAALYGSSKAAAVLLTKAWSAEYGPLGVQVNSVSPGPILTEGMSGDVASLEGLAAGTPTSRVGSPEDVAEAIAFLVSPASGHIHGVDLPVDGGKAAV